MSGERLRIGFIPLVDAAALIVAVDMGFAAEAGVAIDLVREVSWSNVRDKLNIGLFDAAHLLAPLAVASSLGIGHIKVPLVTPFVLGLNGNAITVSPRLYDALAAAADGDLADPKVSASALARVVADRRRRHAEPLVFGMTFPFSTHNYQLRFWMAAGGVDPDEDVRLVVLPPPYMVESLANAQVDGFCVGAPWNSVAVDLGVGRILHLGCDVLSYAPEKSLALRATWVAARGDAVQNLLRALDRATAVINDPARLDEVTALLAKPDRVGVSPELIGAALQGRLRLAADGPVREAKNYMSIGTDGAARPQPVHAAWLYAQMVRWGQTTPSADLLAAAKASFRPDLYDAALGVDDKPAPLPADGVGAFTGEPFDADNIFGRVAVSAFARRQC